MSKEPNLGRLSIRFWPNTLETLFLHRKLISWNANVIDSLSRPLTHWARLHSQMAP
jgi:hypothetical protein